MNAAELTAALKGRWHGSYGSCRCPAHQDRSPSLTVRDGDRAPLLHCHTGCEQLAIIHAIRRMGLWPGAADRSDYVPPRRPPDDSAARTDAAAKIWCASKPTPDSLVEIYLRHRGITLPIPRSLRYQGALKHCATGLLLPAMVAAVQAPDRRVVAVHRTYLRMDGLGKAGVRTPKMALGPVCRGAVRLGPAGPVMGLAEGIESALSAMELFGVPVWAAIGSRLAQIALPAEVREVQIFGDNGEPGHRAAEQAAEALTIGGRKVFVRYPPAGVDDFNDALRAEAAA